MQPTSILFTRPTGSAREDYSLCCNVADPPNGKWFRSSEGTAGCYTFKLKDADVTCRKPASQEIRRQYEQLDSI